MSNLLDSIPVLLNIVLVLCQYGQCQQSSLDPFYKYCPEGKSLFSEQDLINIIDKHADEELEILSHIDDAYNGTANRARDQVIKDFDDLLADFEAHPTPNFTKILDDVDHNLDTVVSRQAELAENTLKELPSLESALNDLASKADLLFKEVKKSDEICKLNNCSNITVSISMRSSIDEEEYLCSTIEYVRHTVDNTLLAFERLEIEKLRSYITYNKDLLEKAISALKLKLRNASIEKFATTMFEILSLQDDELSFLQTLEQFNHRGFIDLLNKQILHINSQLIDLRKAAEGYREHCLNCNDHLNRRRRSVSHSSTNILDRLIADKTLTIQNNVEAAVEEIFVKPKDLILHDPELVNRTIARLEPLEESIRNRTKVEVEKLNGIKKLVPQSALDHVQEVHLTAEHLTKTIDDLIRRLNSFKE